MRTREKGERKGDRKRERECGTVCFFFHSSFPSCLFFISWLSFLLFLFVLPLLFPASYLLLLKFACPIFTYHSLIPISTRIPLTLYHLLFFCLFVLFPHCSKRPVFFPSLFHFLYFLWTPIFLLTSNSYRVAGHGTGEAWNSCWHPNLFPTKTTTT